MNNITDQSDAMIISDTPAGPSDIAKGLSILFLFLLSFLPAQVAVQLFFRGTLSSSASLPRRVVFDLLNCFSGGLLLSAILLQLLVHGLADTKTGKVNTLHASAVAGGVFLVAALEKIGVRVMTRAKPRKRVRALRHANIVHALLSPAGEASPNSSSGTAADLHRALHELRASALSMPPAVLGRAVLGGAEAETAAHAEEAGGDRLVTPSDQASSSRGPQAWANINNSAAACWHCLPKEDSDSEAQPQSSGNSHSMVFKETIVRFASGEIILHEYSHVDLDDEFLSTDIPISAGIREMPLMRGLLLVIALSFHTLFDGLAIGLQDGVYDYFSVYVAVGLHKALVSFSLALEMAIACPRRLRHCRIFMSVFALVAPLGLALGVVVAAVRSAQPGLGQMLQGLAAGAFLYVTFVEILGPHFQSQNLYPRSFQQHHQQHEHLHILPQQQQVPPVVVEDLDQSEELQDVNTNRGGGLRQVDDAERIDSNDDRCGHRGSSGGTEWRRSSQRRQLGQTQSQRPDGAGQEIAEHDSSQPAHEGGEIGGLHSLGRTGLRNLRNGEEEEDASRVVSCRESHRQPCGERDSSYTHSDCCHRNKSSKKGSSPSRHLNIHGSNRCRHSNTGCSSNSSVHSYNNRCNHGNRPNRASAPCDGTSTSRHGCNNRCNSADVGLPPSHASQTVTGDFDTEPSTLHAWCAREQWHGSPARPLSLELMKIGAAVFGYLVLAMTKVMDDDGSL